MLATTARHSVSYAARMADQSADANSCGDGSISGGAVSRTAPIATIDTAIRHCVLDLDMTPAGSADRTDSRDCVHPVAGRAAINAGRDHRLHSGGPQAPSKMLRSDPPTAPS